MWEFRQIFPFALCEYAHKYLISIYIVWGVSFEQVFIQLGSNSILNYYKFTSIMRSGFILLGLSIFKPANKIKLKLPWWVKITTVKPKCVYYFGPFDSQNEAVKSQLGYVEDLKAEKAQEISIEIKQDLPKLLTITEE